jgi:hypothetical protein
MPIPSTDVGARLSALEAYVDMPNEHTGKTVTGRLDAQHSLLVAFRAEFIEFRAETNQRLTSVKTRLTSVETRLTSVETQLTEIQDAVGKVLYGLTEIKRRLPPG